MKVLLTGSAGFIGFHLTKKLIEERIPVIGIDNFNNYYDNSLKYDRINKLFNLSKKFGTDFINHKIDIQDKESLEKIFIGTKPNYVIHLAAQAGVRYSLSNPSAYISSNIVGFANLLECCRNLKINH